MSLILTKSEKKVINNIIDNLKNHPKQWRRDRFQCTHINGVEIWIANEAYGIEVKGQFNGIDNYTIGGVTVANYIFPFLWWKIRLYKAAMQIDHIPSDVKIKLSYPDFIDNNEVNQIKYRVIEND